MPCYYLVKLLEEQEVEGRIRVTAFFGLILVRTAADAVELDFGPGSDARIFFCHIVEEIGIGFVVQLCGGLDDPFIADLIHRDDMGFIDHGFTDVGIQVPDQRIVCGMDGFGSCPGL